MFYALYLVYEGLSFHSAARVIAPLAERSHVAVWKWAQRVGSLKRLFKARRRARCFLVDETGVNVKGLEAWVWVAYEPHQRRLLALRFSWTRSNLTALLFLKQLLKRYGHHPVYTDGGPWYHEACQTLGLTHRRLDARLTAVIERAVQGFKDRTEGFDDYFPDRREGCRLNHVRNWLRLFTLHQQPEARHLTGFIQEVTRLG
jgi:putative transposase